MIKKKVFITICFLCLSVSPLFAIIGSISDPMAQIQRAIMIAEEKLRTLQMIQMIQQTINNVKTAQRMYDMAKRGYQQLSNPDEWKALVDFTKKRMNHIVDWEGDPTNSALHKILRSLDDAGENYLFSLENYKSAARYAKDQWKSFDQESGELTGSTTVLDFYSDSTDWAKKTQQQAYAKRFNPDAEIDSARAAYKAFEIEKEELNKQKTELSKKVGSHSQALAAAMDSNMQAQKDMQSSDDPGEQQRNMNRFTVTKAHVDHLMKEGETLEKETENLVRRIAALGEKIVQEKASLDRKAGVLGFTNTLHKGWVTMTISALATNANVVQEVEQKFFQILVITGAIGFLLLGLRMMITQDSGDGFGVVVGFLGAIIFLSPSSPLAFHKVTKFLAAWSDGISMSFIREVDNPFYHLNDLVSSSSQFLKTVQSQDDQSSLPADQNKGYWDTTMESLKKKAEVFSIGGLALALYNVFMGIIAFVFAVMGSIAIFLSLGFRNLFFWALMAMGPMFIFTAPTVWGRKSVLPRWGAMVYGTILWGPTACIMLRLANTMIGQVTDIMQITMMDNPIAIVLMNAFSAIVLVAAMLAAPLLVYGITQGSFSGISSAVGAAAGGVLGAAAGAGAVGVGFGMASMGGAMLKGGTMLSNSNMPFLQATGSFLQGTGSAVQRSGSTLSNAGSGAFMHSTGLHRLVKAREQKPVNKGK